MKPRYAIYYVPDENSPLGDFGAHWLGWDINRALEADLLPLAGVNAEKRRKLIEHAAPYGFHATLKAPFFLAPPAVENDLLRDAARLAQIFSSPPDFPLKLTHLGRFLALTPTASQPGVDSLAACCVTELDALRAPLTAHDRERRRPEKLSRKQTKLLDQWGYPFVLDEYRFHLTLTGALSEDACIRIAPLIARELDVILSTTVALDAITVVRQDLTGAPFRVLERLPLRSNKEASKAL